MTNNGEANISAEQPPSCKDARLSPAHGDQKRASGTKEATCEGSEAFNAFALLSSGNGRKVHARLRKPSEFKTVYSSGRKYDGRLLTVFVLCQGLSHHRLGITASRKACGIAVRRNRAKRLLRECFRLSKDELAGLRGRYDWVLNSKRMIPDLNLSAVLDEFKAIIERVSVDEAKTDGQL